MFYNNRKNCSYYLNFALFICLFVCSQLSIYAQHYKQQNTPGSELYADAPYRLLKNQDNGAINNIPIHFYVHDSDNGLYNNELMYIDIKVKNASDTVFTHLLTYNNLTDAAFNNLLIHPSVGDAAFGVQDFWSSYPRKSSQHTVEFTKDVNIWLPPIPYVDITQPFFYFTFLIPGNSLSGFGNVLDFEITFGLDWNPDQYVYLRVNRSNANFPKVTGWYRGDVHYHGMFTQNDAENGLPLEATKLAAHLTGLDWITVSDHSCDFDNYGLSMQNNWQRLGQIITQLNSSDTSFIFIRGMELSVNNSDNKIVHALIYPSETAPFSLPYISDGGGDLSGTLLNLNMMNDSLKKYNGFSYAAHPFAEKDALPIFINGSVWNLNDSLFPVNGDPHPFAGTVISNNLQVPSDIYSGNDSILMKSNVVGTQIWNDGRSLYTNANPDDPWNVTHQNASEFSVIPYTNPMHNMYRLYQNMDVYKAILRRGLIAKNKKNSLKNWKCFLSGGSDAHGDFNYSNTNYFDGVSSDYVTDNAIGKLNTLAYCPNGMGVNGLNVLKALRNGNTVMSSGPVLTLSLSANGQNIAIPGNDKFITDLNSCAIHLELFTNSEFGSVNSIALIVGTQSGEEKITLPYFQSTYSLSFSALLAQLQHVSITNNRWFYIRAELETKRLYSYYETQIFKKTTEYFNCFTNPIWLKGNITTNIQNETSAQKNITVYPNPAKNFLYIDLSLDEEIKAIEILSVSGEQLLLSSSVNKQESKFDISSLKEGLYFIRVTTDEQVYLSKFIKR